MERSNRVALTPGHGSDIRPPLRAVRFAVSSLVRAGDIAVDATVGNGLDTEVLARLVGRTGQVFGFDIQNEAIARADRRLRRRNLAGRVTLSLCSHEVLKSNARPSELVSGCVRCVMFNLGYLPGSRSRIVTLPETSHRAIVAATELIGPGGIVTVVVYPGHQGGAAEAAIVDGHLSVIDRNRFWARRVPRLQADDTASYAWLIRRIPTRLAGRSARGSI